MGTREPLKITADFAWIDVKNGRNQLLGTVGEHKARVPITLTGYVTDVASRDDGVSAEFEIQITSQTLGEPEKHDCTCCRCKPVKLPEPRRSATRSRGARA